MQPKTDTFLTDTLLYFITIEADAPNRYPRQTRRAKPDTGAPKQRGHVPPAASQGKTTGGDHLGKEGEETPTAEEVPPSG